MADVTIEPILSREGRLKLSFSKIDLHEQCGLKFRYRHLDRIPEKPSPNLSWGSTIHTVLEQWWDRKLPAPPPVEAMYDALYEAWDDEGFDGMDREKKLEWYQHAREVLTRHHQRFVDAWVPPVAIEQFFTLPFDDGHGGVNVSGLIDMVAPAGDGSGKDGFAVVDWKTNRKAKTYEQVADSLQLAIYAMAVEHLWGELPESVALDFVVPGKRVTVPVEKLDLDAATERIVSVARSIRAGEFPARVTPLCDWCDYQSICPVFQATKGSGRDDDVPGRAAMRLAKLRRQRDSIVEEIEALTRFVDANPPADGTPVEYP